MSTFVDDAASGVVKIVCACGAHLQKARHTVLTEGSDQADCNQCGRIHALSSPQAITVECIDEAGNKPPVAAEAAPVPEKPKRKRSKQPLGELPK